MTDVSGAKDHSADHQVDLPGGHLGPHSGDHASALTPQQRVERARDCWKQRDIRGALALYESALQDNPSFWPARVGCGEALIELGQFARARALFEALTAERPDDFLPVLRLARCVRQLDGAAAALPYFERAWAQSRGNRSAGMACAEVLIELRRHAEAGALLAELLSREPEVTAIHLAQARCARLASGPAAALPHFEAALKIAPDDRAVCIGYADVLMTLGQAAQALPVLQALQQREPRQHAVHVALARCARLRDGVVASIPHLEAAAALVPKDRSVQLTLADALIEARRHEDAHQKLLALREQEPGFHAVHLSLARNARLSAGMAAAMPHLDAALAAAPNDRNVALAHAEGLVNLRRLDEAEQALTALCAREPGFAAAFTVLGRCVRLARGMAAALPHLEAARQLAPQDRGVCLAHAEALVELGRYAEARAALAALQQREPGFAGVHMLLARCARLSQGIAAALPHLQAALQLAPHDRSVALTHADTLTELRRFDEAETALRDLLAREPGFHSAALSLARCLRETRGIEAALPWLEQARLQAPGEPGVQMTYADALLDLGRPDEARACLQSLADAHGDDAQVQLALARCVRRMEGAAAALPLYQQASKCAPALPAVQLALAELHVELRDLDAATAVYDALIDADPKLFQAWLGRARCAATEHGPAAALPALRQAHALAGTHRAVLQALGAGLLAADLIEEAAQIYHDAAQADPSWTAAHVGLARCRHRMGDQAGARQALAAATALLTPGSPLIVEAANLLCDWGDYAALDALAQTVGADAPNIKSALTRCRARACSQQGLHREAIPLLQEALRLWPAHQRELRLALASEHRLLGDLRAAIETLQRIEDAGDSSAQVHVQRCEIARELKEYDAAQRHLLKAMDLRPQPPAVPGLLAQLLSDTGFPDAALQMMTALCEAQPGQFDWARRRCGLLRRYGLLDEALQAVAALQQRFPGHVGALHEAFAVAMAAGELALAGHTLAQMKPSTAADQALWHALHGALAEARWDHEAMTRHYTQALHYKPRVAHYHIALASRHLIDCDIAQTRRHLVAMAEIEAPRRWQQGLSSNISQSHVGQLMDEYLLNRETLACLQRLVQLPPQARVTALLSELDDFESNTASASAVTVALRQAGRFDRVQGALADAEGPSPIPDRISQYWDSEKLPPEIERYMESWRQLNPGFVHQRFSDASAQEWLAAQHPPAVLAAYRKAQEPAMKADYFRLAVLAVEGGFYLDADDRCRRPLRDWVPAQADFVGYQENYGTVGNNFLGVRPAHPVIVLALQQATEAIARGDQDLLWLTTGPGLVTRAYVSVLAAQGERHGDMVARTALCTQTELGRYMAVHCYASYKETTRHWSRAAFNNSGPRGAARAAIRSDRPQHANPAAAQG